MLKHFISVIYSGEAVEVQIEDDEIDSYHVELKTERPPEIDWDLSLQQKPGKEQTVTKVVEEVSSYTTFILNT